MAIIYSYPTVPPTADDLVLGTDVNGDGKPTKNFTIQSIVDIVQGGATGLGAVLTISGDALQQPATNFSNIQGSGTSTFNSFTNGTMTITGGLGTGFTSITSTDFSGNITGIVKTGSSIEGPVTGVTQPAGTSDTTLATTKFVMDKVDPSILTFLGTTGGDQTVNLITEKLSLLGTANEIESVSTAQTITFGFPAAGVVLPNGSTATTQATSDDTDKVATTKFVHDFSDAQDLDFTDGNSIGSVILGGPNAQTFSILGTTNEITTNAANQTLTIGLPSSVTISGTYTGTTFDGDLNGTINTATTGITQTAGNNSTKIATTAYVDNAAGAKTLTYKDATSALNSLNLSTDKLQFESGGTNINIIASAVSNSVGKIDIDLSNDVTITGTMTADTFTTTAGTATWVTTILDGFTSITSTAFVGALTGNATTATALASAGALSFGGEVTLSSSTPSPATYTSGGNIILNLGLNNAAVIGKVLTGLSVPATGNSIEPDDSILSAFGKLQAQHNTSVNGLRYIGTWDARTQAEGGAAGDEGNPALADGGGVVTTGTNTSVVADQLVDSTKNFTTLGVTIGERVYNQAGAFTTVSAVGTTTLTLDEDIFLTNGQTYSVDNNPALNQGEYYVVNQVGTVDLNGNASWAVGDWVIAGAGNTWEKLDQTGVDGTGSINRIPRWDTVSSLNDSIILQDSNGIKIDTGKTLTTQGSGGNLLVGGDATISGLTTASAALSLTGGVNLPTGAYGAANQVLGNANAAGGAGNDLVWITPTTGTVTEVDSGDGLVTNPTAGITTTGSIAIDYLGTDNAILSATDISTGTIATTDQIWFNDVNTGTVTNTLKYAPVSKLPFDNFAGWVLSDNESTPNTTTIVSGGTAKFAGGTYITTGESSGTLTINHNATSRTDTTSTDTPAFGGNFEAVTSVTSNATGHVTAIDVSTVTIPANPVMTAATAAAAGVQGLVPGSAAGDQLKFLRADATWVIPDNDQGVTSVTATAPISSSGGTTPNITHDTSGVAAGTYDSVTVDTKGHVTAGSNPGGSGGGIFSGDQAIDAAGTDTLAFTLTRAATGTLIFDVFLTSETSNATSQAMKFSVAHSYNTEPVFNKVIDTGLDGTTGFTVEFKNSNTGATGTSVICEITSAGGVAQNIGYTVQVGHDSTNTLTFTAAS